MERRRRRRSIAEIRNFNGKMKGMKLRADFGDKKCSHAYFIVAFVNFKLQKFFEKG